MTEPEQGSIEHLLALLDEAADSDYLYFEIPGTWAKVLRDHIRSLSMPQIGWYATYCCVEDLSRIDTQQELERWLDPRWQGPPPKFWPTLEAALTYLESEGWDDDERATAEKLRAAAKPEPVWQSWTGFAPPAADVPKLTPGGPVYAIRNTDGVFYFGKDKDGTVHYEFKPTP